MRVELPPAGIGFGAVEGLITQLDGSPQMVGCTSPFGPRDPIVTPAGTTTSIHLGSDFGYIEKAPLLNPLPWRVFSTAEGAAQNGYGNCVFAVILEGPYQGRSLLWAHMTPGLHVGRFQIIEPGGVVGQLGTTGASTGPHVHFGLTKNIPLVFDVNVYIPAENWDDPIPWLAGI